MTNLNISNIADGALVEQVDCEIQKVLANIIDVNTDATKKRKIVVTLTFEPSDDRDITDVTFETKSQLQPSRKQTTRVAFEKHGSKIVAEELRRGAIKGQVRLDYETGEIIESQTSAKVVNMK